MSTGAFTVYDDIPWFGRPDQAAKAALSDAPFPLARPRYGTHDFFAAKSLSELAREQGVGPIMDITALQGGLPDDEDIDEMLEEIYRSRER